MIKAGPALMEFVTELERERGIPKDVILSYLKEAMVAAYRKFAGVKATDGLDCELNERSGEIAILEQREVVEALNTDPENTVLEMTLKEARRIKPDVEVGDILEIDVTPEQSELGRLAAQAAKQVMTQRLREAEKQMILKEFEEKKGTVATAIVQRIEGRNVVVSIGKTEAILPPREQIPSEYYRVGNKLRVYVLDLRDQGRVPQIIVSQAHPQMVREVFELEVPEIEDGLVEIKSIAREAGARTKVAVISHDPDVDAQGACIGSRGSRIQAIVNELKNEKIDIIRWSEDPIEFIIHALAPAKIARVDLLRPDDRGPRALVVVPDDQLSLAIGREGQNVRLAAKLTNHKLDIKSISQFETMLEEGAFDLAPAPSEEAEAANESSDAAASEEATEGSAVAESSEAAIEEAIAEHEENVTQYEADQAQEQAEEILENAPAQEEAVRSE
ncbi:MAG: transcription termination factor NusA [Vampirovibrionales bacterium]|nr:transcription termination factor NusA [Vampirovibrionales bacterium]